jgi:hypothetical protein
MLVTLLRVENPHTVDLEQGSSRPQPDLYVKIYWISVANSPISTSFPAHFTNRIAIFL